jgi:hypothetical protein
MAGHGVALGLPEHVDRVPLHPLLQGRKLSRVGLNLEVCQVVAALIQGTGNPVQEFWSTLSSRGARRRRRQASCNTIISITKKSSRHTI